MADLYDSSTDTEERLYEQWNAGPGLDQEDAQLLRYLQAQRLPESGPPMPPPQPAAPVAEPMAQPMEASIPQTMTQTTPQPPPQPLRYSLGAFGLDPTIAVPEQRPFTPAPAPSITPQQQADWQQSVNNPLVFDQETRKYFRPGESVTLQAALPRLEKAVAATGAPAAKAALVNLDNMNVHAEMGRMAQMPGFLRGYQQGMAMRQQNPQMFGPSVHERRLAFDQQKEAGVQRREDERLANERTREERLVKAQESRLTEADRSELRKAEADAAYYRKAEFEAENVKKKEEAKKLKDEAQSKIDSILKKSPAAESKPILVRRKTKDGRIAIFDSGTKEFIRYAD